MKRALRVAASLSIVAAVIAFCRIAVHVNNTTVALALLLAVLFISSYWGVAEAIAASLLAAC